MSKVSPPLFIDTDVSAVICAGNTVKLGHHMAGLFLWLLWQAHYQGRALDKDTLLEGWRSKKPDAQPDRTALRRAIKAIETFLQSQFGPLRAKLVVKDRAQTTGPWTLQTKPDSLWNTSTPNPPLALGSSAEIADLPQLGHDAQTAHACAQLLCSADTLLAEGCYEDCAQLLMPHLPQNKRWSGEFTPDATALLTLRWLRVMRRLGRLSQSSDMLAQLDTLQSSLSPTWARYVRVQCELMSLRQVFDEMPQRARLHPSHSLMTQTLSRSTCPQAQAEWSNLQALTLRRNLVKLPKGSARDAMEILTLAYAQAANFWSWVANDPWWQEATAVNYAYLLERLWQHELPGGDPLAALNWYGLSNRLIDCFNLPQDSAWEFVMLGYLYRNCTESTNIDLAEHCLSWPESADPRQPNFYERAIELAQRFGSVRQKISALNLAIWFFKSKHSLPTRCNQLRQRRDALIQGHPTIWKDMVLDGMVSE